MESQPLSLQVADSVSVKLLSLINKAHLSAAQQGLSDAELEFELRLGCLLENRNKKRVYFPVECDTALISNLIKNYNWLHFHAGCEHQIGAKIIAFICQLFSIHPQLFKPLANVQASGKYDYKLATRTNYSDSTTYLVNEAGKTYRVLVNNATGKITQVIQKQRVNVIELYCGERVTTSDGTVFRISDADPYQVSEFPVDMRFGTNFEIDCTDSVDLAKMAVENAEPNSVRSRKRVTIDFLGVYFLEVTCVNEKQFEFELEYNSRYLLDLLRKKLNNDALRVVDCGLQILRAVRMSVFDQILRCIENPTEDSQNFDIYNLRAVTHNAADLENYEKLFGSCQPIIGDYLFRVKQANS